MTSDGEVQRDKFNMVSKNADVPTGDLPSRV